MTLLERDAHDLELRAQVAPPDWRNPPARERYDLVVLGGGTAGLVSAAIAAGLGASVALVEHELLGGDCLNHGCVPSKALLAAARRAAAVRRSGDYGIDAGPGTVDFGAVMERMRRLRAGIARGDGAQRFRGLGVDVFLGTGRFAGRDALEVEASGGGRSVLRFKRAVLATGARPLVVPVPGLDSVPFLTNLSLFTLTELPRRLAVVGAGPIGVEMAQAFARFGSEVTVVAMDPQVLPREDPEAAAIVRAALERDGVRFELGARMSRVERRAGSKVLAFERDGQPGEVVADELLLAMGRAPNVEGLGLEAAGIDLDGRGRLVVDDRLRTTNPRVLAAGDVAGGHQFTHAADAMARLVIQNAFFFGRGRASDLTMSWCTYTEPEVAHVGLYEGEEQRAGCALASRRMDFSEIDRSRLEGETEGFAKLVHERRSGRLRGATVAGAHAGELIGEMLLAVRQRLKVTELSAVIHPYPTAASIWGRLGDQASGARLTPLVAKVLQRVIAWRR